MRYFKNLEGVVSGFDETNPSQLPYMQKAIDAGDIEITGSWPPATTQSQTQTVLSASLTSAINDGAQQWGYDDIVSAVSYVNSTNPQYVAEANALIHWRDTVWAWAIPALANVTPGETPATFLANMPELPNKPVVS
jgi:hypothetical protein